MRRGWGLLGLVLVLAGCTSSGVQGALTTPDGTGMCVAAEAGDVFAFGVPVKNDTGAVFTIASVGAGQSGIEIEGPWLAPPVSGDDEQPVFVDEFPPAELADWDAAVAAQGAALAPGDEAYLIWSMTLAAGSTSGRLDGLAILNGDGEGSPITGVWAGLAPAPEDAAAGPDCGVLP